MTDKTLPTWWDRLINQHRQGVARVFILHGNVNDVVYYPDTKGKEPYRSRPKPFRDMLIYLLARRGQPLNKLSKSEFDEDKDRFVCVFYASPTIPLTLYYVVTDEDLNVHTLQRVYVDREKLRKYFYDIDKTTEPDAFLKGIPGEIESKKRDLQSTVIELLFELEPLLERSVPRWLQVVLILDFFEKITTQREKSSHYKAEEIIRRWALSDRIKRSPSMIIGLTVDVDALPQLLLKSDSQIQKIEIPVPGLKERFEFLRYWSKPIGTDKKLRIDIGDLQESTVKGSSPEFNINQEEDRPLMELAGLTKGFRLLNLEAMVRMSKAKTESGKIDQKIFKQHKANLINEESGQLLEEIQTKRDFDSIGGLEYAKDYFRQVADAIAQSQLDEKNLRYVPKGILLSGPPGTGKTILAEALASSSKMTLVRLGDIRGRFVGESERNMSNVLKLLVQLAPVIVFIDEIDQTIGRRGTSYEGDSGVSRRLFGKLLAFMGDNAHRGKVLWVGASNRPDLIDEAMISRFDTVIPILPPYEIEERKKILMAMERNVEGISYSEDVHQNIDDIAAKLRWNSGRAIETIVRKAAYLAKSETITKDHLLEAISLYKPNVNIKETDIQVVYALMAANFVDMIPQDISLYPERLRSFVKEALETRSNEPLERCLREIETGSIYAN